MRVSGCNHVSFLSRKRRLARGQHQTIMNVLSIAFVGGISTEFILSSDNHVCCSAFDWSKLW